MKLTHIHNACCLYESGDSIVISDPWLVEGAFAGSWGFKHPLKFKPNDINILNLTKKVYIYISHIHPDHFDAATLRKVNKQIPIILYENKNDFLYKSVKNLGFKEIYTLKDGETQEFGPFKITLYGPFVKHLFDESVIGNLIDSAIVISDGNMAVLNANDNTPDLAAISGLKSTHGKIDIAQLKYTLAGAYPSCFIGLSDYDKKREAQRLVKRQYDYIANLMKEFGPDTAFMPFAGEFQLIGTQSRKNAYLGSGDPEEACSYLKNQGIKIFYQPAQYDTESSNQKAIYAWEDRPYIPSPKKMNELVRKAIDHLKKWHERLGYVQKMVLEIHLTDAYEFNFVYSPKDADSSKRIKYYMNSSLFYRILTRNINWNTAEVGCHFDIEREPNVYDPDFHMLMSFFHA